MPISNMVYIARAGQSLDLWKSEWLEIMTYQPPRRQFPGACLRLGSGTFLLFESGKVVINGVKTTPVLDEVNHLLGVKLIDLQLSHISGYMTLQPIDLLAMAKAYTFATYEPEIHPGLIFKINNVSVIVYHTGSVIYCGCRSLGHTADIEAQVKAYLTCS